MDKTYNLLNIINAEIDGETLGTPDKLALDSIFKEIDDILLNGDFVKIDEILAKANVEGLAPQITLAILTATFAASDKLPSRKEFLERTRSVLIKNLKDEPRVDRLLRFL